MAITKQTVSIADGVSERGQVQIKTITRVTEEGALISETVNRRVLNPGDSTDGEAEQVVAVANAVWTQAVIDAWNAGQTPPPAVPQEVTRRQARQALAQSGMLAAVQPAIDAIADPLARTMMQIEWDDSQTFQRQRGTLIQMGTALGLTSTDLDNLFKLAATL
jgi:hypothetical protein